MATYRCLVLCLRRSGNKTTMDGMNGVTESRSHGDSEEPSRPPSPPSFETLERPLAAQSHATVWSSTNENSVHNGSLPDSSSSSAGTLQFPIVELVGKWDGGFVLRFSGECTLGSAGRVYGGARAQQRSRTWPPSSETRDTSQHLTATARRRLDNWREPDAAIPNSQVARRGWHADEVHARGRWAV